MKEGGNERWKRGGRGEEEGEKERRKKVRRNGEGEGEKEGRRDGGKEEEREEHKLQYSMCVGWSCDISSQNMHYVNITEIR